MTEQIKAGFTEVWNLYKRSYTTPDTAAAYDALLEEAHDLAEKYDRCEVVKDLLAAVLMDIDRNTKAAAQSKTE